MRNLIIGIALGIVSSCAAVQVWSPGMLDDITLIPDTKNGGLRYPHCSRYNRWLNNDCKDEKYLEDKLVPIKGNVAVKNFVCKHISRKW